MPTPIRVLLLEDSAADEELVVAELARAGVNAVVQRVDSERSFVSALQDFAPDVIVSDHSLAQFNALAAIRVVHAHRPASPVIVVSGAADDQLVVRCVRAGAEDFVSKSCLDRLPDSIVAALTIRARLRDLTPRQMEVFRLIAGGFTTRQIATLLRISSKTVETHRSAVMKRLDVHDVAGLVRYAVRVGLGPSEN